MEMIDLSLDHGARLEDSDGLVTAAERGRLDMVGCILDRGVNVDEIGFHDCLKMGEEAYGKVSDLGIELRRNYGAVQEGFDHLRADFGAFEA